MSKILWQKSSFSGGDTGNACIELALGADEFRLIRESDDPDVVMTSDVSKLRAFIAAAKGGEFDHLI
ncbi:DUF397 domain-containing protein [Kitasatospora sp. NBC_00458]|uniref:DUF397 domain-containing protein n=1 Tax=Kitasatospora sp. NBC_00458 TaxID=2903568 RepID=UPI002E16EB14